MTRHDVTLTTGRVRAQLASASVTFLHDTLQLSSYLCETFQTYYCKRHSIHFLSLDPLFFSPFIGRELHDGDFSVYFYAM
jgi:hypothetical protein